MANGKTEHSGQTLVLDDALPEHHLELPDGAKIAYRSPMDLSERDEMELVKYRRLLDMAQVRWNRAKGRGDQEKAEAAYRQAQNGYIKVLLPDMPENLLRHHYNRFQKNRIIMFWNEQYAGLQRAAERALDEMMDGDEEEDQGEL